ncbi:MAG: RNA polymerase sigma factor RpoD/SigA [Treponema sp.]|nr:RNA polymerase sigma factor RpoD/SigA [Treponema sp.]MEE3435904.1 RNA polymerase sigma factor RpoD/SigA [Treponema sp.]
MANDKILSMYLKEINKVPLLTKEEENDLAAKAKAGDQAARQRIASANLRFVVNIAKKYRHSGMDMTDLISEGNVGLMTAIDKFDPQKGYRFISYAVWWIRQSILKAIYETKDAIRLPLNRVNELVKIKKVKKSLGARKSEEEEIKEVAAQLNMERDTVRDLLAISQEMLSLDSSVQGSESEEAVLGDFIEDTRYEDPEEGSIKNAMKRDVRDVLGNLKPKEAQVIRLRYGLDGTEPMSLKEVGDICKLTKERIRQIEKNAIERAKVPASLRAMQAYVAA